jgi:hypothetical protein
VGDICAVCLGDVLLSSRDTVVLCLANIEECWSICADVVQCVDDMVCFKGMWNMLNVVFVIIFTS